MLTNAVHTSCPPDLALPAILTRLFADREGQVLRDAQAPKMLVRPPGGTGLRVLRALCKVHGARARLLAPP
nr:hypothetical protein KPHV_41020 [Kitasatospora purpeofusca]